jgi:predicted peptidase
MSGSQSDTDRSWRWIFALVTIVLWIDANIILYWWLDDSPGQKRQREPDLAVLDAYREHAVNVGDMSLRYRLLPPAQVVAGRRYPLIVYLHGAGEVGSDNRRQLNDLPSLMVKPDYRERFDCFVLAPQCPEGATWTTPIAAPVGGVTTEYVTPSMPAIEAVMAEHAIDPQRVYLTGFSMGGFGTWRLAAERPELFAAIVPVCGGGDPASAPKLVGIPVWAVHGGLDKAVPVEQSQRMVDALTHAGGGPQLNVLPETGHESKWAYALDSGVLDWMFEQRRPE